MRYLSVCSGIEAASVAWAPFEWTPVGVSEIAEFPCAVLEQRFSQIPNYGNMLAYKEWSCDKIDLIVGGTPCQSFSVAGKRGGLDDPRGNLMLVYLQLLDHFKPKWFVWENVPGVLSSGGGRDFGSFLGAMGKLGYGWAYRVLDAQYFGVPQRRRRVFVVGCAGGWEYSAKVLFESESLPRYTTKSQKPREEDTSIIATLSANGGGTTRPAGNCNELDFCVPVAFAQNTRDEVRQLGGNLAGALPASPGMKQQTYLAMTGSVTHTLSAEGFDASEDGTGRGNPIVNSRNAVRRLTPVECERLQGFPDNYTNIIWKGETAPDGLRYKALGNSMAVPVMRWIGERIKEVNDAD